MLHVAFAGTPDFAVPTLEALLAANDINVKCVLTQPDRPAGRGRQLSESAVKQCALAAGLTVWQPEKLSTPEHADRLRQMNLDALIVVAYGQLLKSFILTIPRLGCLNVHASLLPRWRGAAPIQRAIQAGDVLTGITIMQMDVGLDTGPMLSNATIEITPATTAARLHDQLATLGGPLLVQTLTEFAAGRRVGVPQPESDTPSYAHKIEVQEALIDWQQPAESVLRHIHAFNPFPGAFTYLDSERIKLFEVSHAQASPLPAGWCIRAHDGSVIVGTGTSPLICLSLQFPGQKRLDVAQIRSRHPAPWTDGCQFSSSPGRIK